MFQSLVKELVVLLPDFGERLVIDSKSIQSFSKKSSKKTKVDGRRDLDADVGIKDIK